MRDQATRRLAYGGLMAALIALLTAYVHLSVFIPMQAGYAHLGDVGIVLASIIMGPFAAVPAALGSALVDVLLGAFATYAPFTLVIKGVMGFVLGKFLVAKRFSVRNACLLLLMAAFMVGAYFLTDTLLYGVEAAIGSVVGNCVQGAAMLAGGVVIGNPIPEEFELDYDEMEEVIQRALKAAEEEGIHGKDTTPFLLSHIKDYTMGVSFASNLQLAYNNAKVAARIAMEYAKLK